MARPVSIKGPVKNLSVQLLLDEYEALAEAAKAEGVSKVAIVRRALRKELKLGKQKRSSQDPKTPLSLAV